MGDSVGFGGLNDLFDLIVDLVGLDGLVDSVDLLGSTGLVDPAGLVHPTDDPADSDDRSADRSAWPAPL